jgi:hypothetical protein
LFCPSNTVSGIVVVAVGVVVVVVVVVIEVAVVGIIGAVVVEADIGVAGSAENWRVSVLVAPTPSSFLCASCNRNSTHKSDKLLPTSASGVTVEVKEFVFRLGPAVNFIGELGGVNHPVTQAVTLAVPVALGSFLSPTAIFSESLMLSKT